MIWGAISIGLSFLIFTLAAQWRLRALRRKRLQGIELRPNCLLTRYPIIFVASPRSLFRIFEPWNDIPGFLREHGYEVFVLEPHFSKSRNGSKTVIKQIQKALDSLARGTSGPLSQFHLVADSSMEHEWVELARHSDSRIASLTLAVRETSRSPLQAKTDRVQSLKPLASVIEELRFDDLAWLLNPKKVAHWNKLRAPSQECERTAIGVQTSAHGWNRLAVFLLRAHNLFLGLRNTKAGRLDPLTVGQILTPNWVIESRFLNRAVELAERDAQLSD